MLCSKAIGRREPYDTFRPVQNTQSSPFLTLNKAVRFMFIHVPTAALVLN